MLERNENSSQISFSIGHSTSRRWLRFLQNIIHGKQMATHVRPFIRIIIIRISLLIFTVIRIRFTRQWYGPLGAAIFWISCIVISYLTGGQDLNELDLNLLAPCIRNLLPKKYRHTHLQVLVVKPADETVDGDKNELNASEWVWKNDEKNQI